MAVTVGVGAGVPGHDRDPFAVTLGGGKEWGGWLPGHGGVNSPLWVANPGEFRPRISIGNCGWKGRAGTKIDKSIYLF